MSWPFTVLYSDNEEESKMPEANDGSRPKPIPIAPATKSSQPTSPMAPPNMPNTMPYTCQTCTRRKVRCDKITPICSSCRKSRLECTYQAPPPRKKKRPLEGSDDLQERVSRYEDLLKKNGILTEDSVHSPARAPSSEAHSSASPSTNHRPLVSLAPEKSALMRPGRLLSGSGKTRYVDSNLWRNLGAEDLGGYDEEEEPAGQDGPNATYETPSDPISASFFSPPVAPEHLTAFHPSPVDGLTLWSFYLRNVEPLIKIFHVPSMDRLIKKAVHHPSEMSRAMEAALFAIYQLALVSMTDEECVTHLRLPRAMIQPHFETASRRALVNAHFLRTTDLLVVQAFFLFLMYFRPRAESSEFWVYTGVAVRMAQRLGLHRDGEALGLSPYETQLRRRLWWQLLPLDGVAGQLSGSSVVVGTDTWDTQHPLNINDSDFDVDTVDTPKEREGATDMMFYLTRSQVARWHQFLHRKIGNTRGVFNPADYEMLEQSVNDLEAVMESRFLRYCDLIDPLHHLTHMMARGVLASTRLRMRLPRIKHMKNPSDEDRRSLYDLAMKILEYDWATFESPHIARYMWLMRSFFHWDALIWILHEIRERYLSPDECALSWDRISRTYHIHSEIYNAKGALSSAARKLTMRTWDVYCAYATGDPSFGEITEPDLIAKFRTIGKQSERPGSAHQTPNMQITEHPSQADHLNMWFPPALGSNDIADPWSIGIVSDFNMDRLDWIFLDAMNASNPASVLSDAHHSRNIGLSI